MGTPMSESLDNQIIVDTTEVFFPYRELSVKKVGRKRLLNREKYLEAVKKLGTDSPNVLSEYLGVSRTTIWRVRKNEVSDIEVEQILSDVTNLELKPYQMSYKGFLHIPIVKLFHELNVRNEVSGKVIRRRIGTLLNICKYLNVHPRRLKPEQCANLLLKVKNMPLKERPHGISWSTGRGVVRSFFELIYGISGQKLTALGIHGKLTNGSGSKARQRLIIKQRHEFFNALEEVVEKRFKEKVIIASYLALPKFMFYTATRITASLNARIEDIVMRGEIWFIKIVDKGRNGGITWYKILLGELKDEIEKILELREYPPSGFLFEGLRENMVRIVFREAYEKIGIKVGGENGIDVTHIWRHTFAQDMLEATNYNYEIVASIGGWKSTQTLKKHYGEIGDIQRIRALKKAMGEKMEETNHEFKF